MQHAPRSPVVLPFTAQSCVYTWYLRERLELHFSSRFCMYSSQSKSTIYWCQVHIGSRILLRDGCRHGCRHGRLSRALYIYIYMYGSTLLCIQRYLLGQQQQQWR